MWKAQRRAMLEGVAYSRHIMELRKMYYGGSNTIKLPTCYDVVDSLFIDPVQAGTNKIVHVYNHDRLSFTHEFKGNWIKFLPPLITTPNDSFSIWIDFKCDDNYSVMRDSIPYTISCVGGYLGPQVKHLIE